MKLPQAVLAKAQAWRAAFRASGAQRLGLFLEDRHDFAAALFAAWAERKQVVLPGDALPATVAALSPHVDALVGEFPGRQTLQPGAPLHEAWVEPEREAVGLIVFTSGSTGVPTAIPKKLRQLLDEVATLEATFGARFGEGAVVLSTVSHQHIYGLLCAVLWPLAAGRALGARRIEYPEQLEAELGERPAVLVSSPAHLKRLQGGRAWRTGLKAVFSSGGPLPEAGASLCREVLGLQPIEIYGSSETGGVAWREGSQSPWRPFRGVELRASAEGLLELRSPHLAGDGWFSTADRVRLDEEHFTLLGRADRIAKVEEKRVSLELIERTALATGSLTEARAVVLDGARVTLGLVGVLAPGAGDRKLVLQRLKDALADAVERVAIPRRFRFVEALPVNATGKVTERALQALFEPPKLLPEVQAEERSGSALTVAFTVAPELTVLEGHFPGVPVVPGVAQLAWALEWGRAAFGFGQHVSRLEALKYQALMLPGHQVKASLTWSAEKSTLSFKFTSETAVYASGRVVLAP